MGKTPTDSLRLVLKETGSTSRLVNPSDSISDFLIDVTLPHELITEILVCLPVRSLLRFKCVSKPWLSLISNPQFIRSHFSKSSFMVETDGLNLELLFSNGTRMKKCSLYSALHLADPSKHLSAIEIPAQFHDSIVGIVNGLVCLKLKENDLCVLNPALNKSKHLNVHPVAPSGPRSVSYFYSFGYDESTDDYKVVCLQTVLVNDGVYHTEVRIYSLKADCWRSIDPLKGFYLPDRGVFANGKIYWSVDRLARPNGKIVSLDMSSEKFVEMQYPKYDAGQCVLKMGVSGGRPFVSCDYDGEKVDLWVLDKHGVEESWSKFVSIPYTAFFIYEMESFYFDRLICILRNGEIVFGGGYDLLVYNWKEKDYRKIQLAVDTTENWTDHVSCFSQS